MISNSCYFKIMLICLLSETNSLNSLQKKKIVTPKIETPFNVQTPSPILPSGTTTQRTIIITPAPNSQSIAKSKCEQYRSQMAKMPSLVDYIFGGTQSLIKEFPHMAALGYGPKNNLKWLCGGSLISEQYVITAAHCIKSDLLGEVNTVRLGTINLHTPNSNAQDYTVVQKIIHPNYQLPSQYNDLALLKLNQPVSFTPYVFPICLEVSDLIYSDFIATGWGQTDIDGSLSENLMKVDLDFFPNVVCRENYKNVIKSMLPDGVLADRQICAGSYVGIEDTCQGDSGGPLQARRDTLYLVGVTSFGKSCGIPNNPGVYTKIPFYVPWIEQTIWK